MQDKIIYWRAFASYVWKRFATDKCSSVAAELTVTSMLALVPLTTVIFSLLSLVPDFQHLALQLQQLLFEYFVPATGESVQLYLQEFVGKAKGMSGLGLLMLLITALLMMRTIDSSFNNIWQIKSRKSFLRTFLVYWAVLTLGPIFLGTSLGITSYLKSLPLVSDAVQQDSLWVSMVLPMLMETVAFTVMFLIVPNRRILWTHAFSAALVTAILFELAKSGFGVFVEYFSTYQVIFGALATIPLFLIWVYLSWSIILFGAEICHGLFAFEITQQKKAIHPFIQLTDIVLQLIDKQKNGDLVTEQALARDSHWGQQEASVLWLEKMIEQQLVVKSQDQSYCLSVSSTQITYAQIYRLAGNQLPSEKALSESHLSRETQQAINQLRTDMDFLLGRKLSIPVK
jgi:membrane protein